jgi:glycosyltransferase involved in cell wall biosynthesis
VFVLSSDFEGNPLSVMEAMASGLPIVSTEVGGVPALFENYKQGLLVRAGDVLGLSTAMVFLLENKATRRNLGVAAARRAKDKFDVSLMVDSYENLYDQILARARRMRPETYSCKDHSTGPAGARGSKLATL